VWDLALCASLASWLVVAKDKAFFGACTTLSVVVSHYDSIDLQSIGEGFTDGQFIEELDARE
jgi:hypothetical protein